VQSHTLPYLLNTQRHKAHQDCVQLPTSADNVTLLAFAAERRPCSNRPISPTRRAHSSKPAEAACGGRMMEQTDGRTTDRYIDPPTRMQGASIEHSTRSTRQKERERKRGRGLNGCVRAIYEAAHLSCTHSSSSRC